MCSACILCLVSIVHLYAKIRSVNPSSDSKRFPEKLYAAEIFLKFWLCSKSSHFRDSQAKWLGMVRGSEPYLKAFILWRYLREKSLFYCFKRSLLQKKCSDYYEESPETWRYWVHYHSQLVLIFLWRFWRSKALSAANDKDKSLLSGCDPCTHLS